MTNAQMVAWLETQYTVNENGCWVWKGRKNINGYVDVWWEGKYYKVHRLYWLLKGKTIPEGLQMCHGPCHNRACFNPDHLTPGTSAENNADKVRDGTDAKGDKHGRAKLTNEQVLAIRANPENKSYGELSKVFGVAPSTISEIVNRKIWKHI